jgi:bifunctional UDP-N-acetylglucosamine pyrophosphorylase/glucosamine-1-phosphate N-acetyltransferase
MIEVVILAAGKGKRMMREDLPKVLVDVCGTSLVEYVIRSVEQSGVSQKPIVVVGFKPEMVTARLGDRVRYATQSEQLGTGHAVACAQTTIDGAAQDVLVLCGDMPLITPQTITRLLEHHRQTQSILTMGTATVTDFNDWRSTFYDFGRIVRNAAGDVAAIVEKKDATSEQLLITEVNPAYYCFNRVWLAKMLPRLRQQNAQAEYYLTDLVKIAMDTGAALSTIAVEPVEALGVNTPEQLELVKRQLAG